MKKISSIKTIAVFMGIFLLVAPTTTNALFWINGTSDSGSIAFSTALLIPLPLFNLTVTESEQPIDIFGVAQLSLSEHDDVNNYNTLLITPAIGDPLEIPVPYGSFGLHYLTVSGWPSPDIEESEIAVYLSVANGIVKSTIVSNTDFTISIEREELLQLLALLVPETAFDEYIAEGPFDIEFSLQGNSSGEATVTNPTISGSFDYSLTLPQDVVNIEFPIELPDHYAGNVSLDATFNWDKWTFFTPIAGIELSATLTFNGKEHTLGPVQFDMLPSGTLVFWLDKKE